jgi:hypothetical protein
VQRKASLISNFFACSNGWFGENRCAAENIVLRARGHSASAKLEKRRSGLSAQQTSMQSAANVGNPPLLSMLSSKD